MVLSARGRAAYGLVAATLLTVAALGWENRGQRGHRPAAAAEGTVAGRGLVTSPPLRGPSTDASRPSPGGAAQDERPVVPAAASGRLAVVPGTGKVLGAGRLRQFRVAVEVGLPESPGAFAAAVERTLADPRGWGADGRLSFQRVAGGGADFTVVLATAATTDRLCRPLDTSSIYSCFSTGRSVINVTRWREGASAYAGDLVSYRSYVVLHEVGHALGHGHQLCPGPGRLAPTMMQQTKGVGACLPNPWPFPDED